jgi:antitoxin VapB
MTEPRRKPAARRRSAKRRPPEYRQPETKPRGLEEAASLPISGLAAEPAERRVRLFKNGRSQAVRMPREFELPGKEAIMRKEGERLILEPAKPKTLLAVLATLEPLDEELPPIDDQLLDPVDL